jgi:hypothetical protein
VGRLVFSAGVLGASLVAAIVSSLALAWGIGEVAGYRRSLEHRPFKTKWFYGVYVASVAGAAAVVWFVPDLVWLNIAAQVLNAFFLPLVIGFLVALAVKTLPERMRPRGWYLWILIGISAGVIALGLYGGVSAGQLPDESALRRDRKPLRASSISRRVASERDGSSGRPRAQDSMRARNCVETRTPIMGVTPVEGRPRFFRAELSFAFDPSGCPASPKPKRIVRRATPLGISALLATSSKVAMHVPLRIRPSLTRCAPIVTIELNCSKRLEPSRSRSPGTRRSNNSRIGASRSSIFCLALFVDLGMKVCLA